LKDPSSQNSTSQKKPSQKAKPPWYRRWLAKVWHTHGGGLYAVGYVVTFLYLEARSILEELAESTGPVDFLTGHLFEFIFRFLGDSIMNMVQALIWFIPVVQFKSPFGLISLGIGFYAFDIYLREPVERWILQEDEDS